MLPAKVTVTGKTYDTSPDRRLSPPPVEIITVHGSVEVAPLLGLAHAIVDLVDTGNTLRANMLRAVEDIAPISSRLIVNPASLKLKRADLEPVIAAFAKAARG